MVEGNVMLIEEGSDLFPDMVDAVGWVATEKPSLLLVAKFHESRRLYEEKVPQKWVGTISNRFRGDQVECCADCCDNVFRAFDP